jgi:benzoyl-CoA-dihydrodiol lyase
MDAINFETHPDRYRHLKLEADGSQASIKLKVDEGGGLRPGYQLKLNSYDLAVDIELADAIQRLRFEHPEVSVVTITSATEGTFCAGANIFMLASSEHGFKVNFCKFTNETRLAMEEASALSGQRYVAAINGIASGGGYELALACDQILLVDDRRSAVSLPEIPYLGVLPGTGGLTRLIDKRKVRRDLADIFVTLAEGVRGERALKWGLVDAIIPRSGFLAGVNEHVARMVARDPARSARRGIKLDALNPAVEETEIRYRHVTLKFDHRRRLAKIVIDGPASVDQIPGEASDLGADWYPIRMLRELDDAILRLRFNYPEIGLVLLKSRGDLGKVLALDATLDARRSDWLVNETLLLMRRAFKRLDLTAKSLFAVIEKESCFAGFLLEGVLAADRAYMQTGARIATSALNGGSFPMVHGLTRMQARFLGDPARAEELCRAHVFDAAAALEAGLITSAPDELDWNDELRIAIDERLSLSPDALTGMEASLRFGGPETMESKIFARLSAWQNWIFQRPNAVGERGALKLYGQPQSPQFDWRRT